MDFSTWETSDFIAIYAALVATFIATWDIVKWATSGARLKLRTQYDMVLAGHPTRQGTFIIASVINQGALPATLTNLAGVTYGNRFFRWQRSSPARTKPRQSVRRMTVTGSGSARTGFACVRSWTRDADRPETPDVLGPPRATADGRELVYSRRVTEGDLWLVTIH